jgi:hypothetical protein
MQFSSVSVHSMCFNCSHEMCRACPTIDFGSHSHDLRLHDTAHEGHDTSLKKTTPILSGLSQAQDANRHDGPYVRGRAGDGANSEQDHQMQPHGEHFETQQTLPVPGRNKRKLNMTKCERCRTDKKAVSNYAYRKLCCWNFSHCQKPDLGTIKSIQIDLIVPKSAKNYPRTLQYMC